MRTLGKQVISFFLLFSITTLQVDIIGQNLGNLWYFGEGGGLDFSECEPIVLTDGANSGFEGCSTMSDSEGNLLFYTNSEFVWDKNHEIMPNGILIPNGQSLSQVIILESPSDPDIYYIITTQRQCDQEQHMQYHIVDMALNSNNGDVATCCNQITDLWTTEHAAATYHANGQSIWVVTHEYLTNRFVSVLLDGDGIFSEVVLSEAGPSIIQCNSCTNARGQLKFSVDGSKIALAANGVGDQPGSDVLMVAAFDDVTGSVHSPFILPVQRGDFAVEFSPDGNYLYSSTWKALNFSIDEFDYLSQFNLSSNDSLTIANSRHCLDSTLSTTFGDLKLAPNGKIYSTHQNSEFLDVITYPNLPGGSCQYSSNDLYLEGATVRAGLNHHVAQFFDCVGSIVDERAPDEITIMPNPATSQIRFSSPKNCAGYITCKILDTHGNIVVQFSRRPERIMYTDICHLSSGIYIFEIQYDNIKYQKKLVVIN